MRRWARMLSLLVLLGAVPARAMPELDVPLDHWSYEFAERLVVRAGLGRTFLDLRPLTRREMAEIARRLQGAARGGDWTPTRIESQQLAMLRAEFSEELVAGGDTLGVLQRAYHVWRGDGWRLQAFWRGRELLVSHQADPGQGEPQVDASLRLEPAAALRLGAHMVGFVQLDYRVRTSTASLFNSADVRGGDAEFVFEPRDRFSIVRALRPLVRYDAGRWRIDLERGQTRWGPGRQNAMLLMDATPAFDRLRFQLALGPVRFTSLAGQLRPARLGRDDGELRERYLAAHRLEFAAGSRFQFAFSEALVYGNRGLDLSYLNPLAVLFVTQANNGDIDNALASADGSLRLGRTLHLYGECVLDDLNLRRGLAHFGNKPGVVAGFLWLEPFGARDWDVEGEWSWASQFTYTHHTPIDRYEHYGATLGSRTGPDSDLWVFGLRRRLSRGWAVRGFYELERHGEGSLAIGDDDRQGDRQEFLSGVVESWNHPGLEIRYRGLRSLQLQAVYRYLQVTHPGHDPQSDPTEAHEVLVQAQLEF